MKKEDLLKEEIEHIEIENFDSKQIIEVTTLGIEFDIETAWDERKQLYRTSGNIINTMNICQSAKGKKEGLWTTVVATTVFIT